MPTLTLLKEIRPNIIWDVIKWTVIYLVGTGAGTRLLQWGLTMPFDIAISIAVLTSIFLLLLYGFVRSLRTENRLPEVEQPVARKPVRRGSSRKVQKPDVKYKPNIVVLYDGHTSHFVYETDSYFRKVGVGTRPPTHVALAAKFENIPDPPNRVGSDSKVCAKITYSWLPTSSRDRGMTPVNQGCWIDNDGPFITFPLNTPKYLLIGLFEIGKEHSLMEKKGGPMKVFGYSLETNSPTIQFGVNSNEHIQLWVNVDLIMGEYGEWTQNFEFLLRAFNGSPTDLTPRRFLQDPDKYTK